MGAFARGFILGAASGVAAVLGAAMVSVIREDWELKNCVFGEFKADTETADSEAEEEKGEEDNGGAESDLP